MSQPIRLMIRIEDDLFYGECVAAALASRDSFEVLISTGSNMHLMDEITIQQPDILMLDLQASVNTTVNLAQLNLTMMKPKVIILALPDTESTIVRCIEMGVSGYVTKNAALDDLIAVIDSVHRGETICSPKIAYSVFSRVAELSMGLRSRQSPEFMSLSPREGQVVALIIDGLSNKRIAERLYLSLYTVKNHVHSILKKLKLQSRTEMIALHSHLPANLRLPRH